MSVTYKQTSVQADSSISGTAQGDGGDILMLCHRIPFPPDKGDKIRSFNMLKFLANKGFRIHLGALVDEPEDARYLSHLEELCASVHLVSVTARTAKLGSVAGVLRGTSMSVEYFYHADLQKWTDSVLARESIQAVLCICAPMAEYIFRTPSFMESGNTPRLLLDFMDVDSEKWREYAHSGNWLMRGVYALESAMLRRYEARIADIFDVSLLVSDAERDVFRSVVLEKNSAAAKRVIGLTNGVDTEYFSPVPVVRNHMMVFCGAMDYLPNVDAVEWFARSVFPLVQAQLPDARFTIVGSKPVERVKALESLRGVRVTGRVPDVRPYVHEAGLSVVPLRIARGVQNKVLEAMAMGCPVLATPEALEGVRVTKGHDVLEAPAEATTFAKAVLKFFAAPPEHGAALGKNARDTIEREYTWASSLEALRGLVQNFPAQMKKG